MMSADFGPKSAKIGQNQENFLGKVKLHNFVKNCPILMVYPSNESLDIEFSTNHKKVGQISISWFMELWIWQVVIWQVPKWRQVASYDVMTSDLLLKFRICSCHQYLAAVKIWSQLHYPKWKYGWFCFYRKCMEIQGNRTPFNFRPPVFSEVRHLWSWKFRIMRKIDKN